MTEKKTNFLDAIKAAQSVKNKVPAAKAKLVQQEKAPKGKSAGFGNKVMRKTGRGG